MSAGPSQKYLPKNVAYTQRWLYDLFDGFW